jgi:hypothetical protein
MEFAMPVSIIKRNEQEFAEWLSYEWGFLCSLASFDDEPLVLEPYQIAFLQSDARFRWVTKSRQVGLSFLFALEALARCHLRDKAANVGKQLGALGRLMGLLALFLGMIGGPEIPSLSSLDGLPLDAIIEPLDVLLSHLHAVRAAVPVP